MRSSLLCRLLFLVAVCSFCDCMPRTASVGDSGLTQTLPTEEPRRRTRRTRLVALLTVGDQPISRPTDVAVGPRTANIYLADSGNNHIQVFDKDGVFLRTLGGPNTAFRFKKLLGLAVDREERIYGVDTEEGVIQSATPEGNNIRRVDLSQYFPRVRLGLVDAVIGPDGRIFAVDNFNNRVAVIGAKGLLRTVGQQGRRPGDLSAPTFCALDRAANLYLAEALNGRVQVFNPGGKFLRSLGRPFDGPGGFGRPKGVAVSVDGEIYVADSWLNTIQVFSPRGEFLAVLTDEFEKPLDLGSPNGIALDGRGRIYIAERLANRLQIREIIPEPRPMKSPDFLSSLSGAAPPPLVTSVPGSISEALEHSPHDLSGQTYDAGATDRTKERCGICHLPLAEEGRTATKEIPHSLKKFGAPSLVCFSCHDGTTIVSPEVDAAATAFHPGSHGTALEADRGRFVKGIALPYLDGDRMECVTCHDPHDNSRRPFLRAELGELCLLCHGDKVGGGKETENPAENHLQGRDPEIERPAESPVTVGAPYKVPFPTSYPPANGKLSDGTHWNLGGHLAQGKSGPLLCVTCHAVHGDATDPPGDNLLATAPVNDGANLFCEGCHQNRVSENHHPVGAGLVGDCVSGKVLSCTRCHRAHNAFSPLLSARPDSVAACSECHPPDNPTCEPKPESRASHFIGDPTLSETYSDQNPPLRRYPWSESGLSSRYGGGEKGQAVVCLSCHTFRKGALVSGDQGQARFLLARSGNPVEPEAGDNYLCIGCHRESWGAAARQGHTHPLMRPDISKYNIKPFPPTTYTPSGHLNCDSCHRPHEARTSGGYYILEAATSKNNDPRAIHPAIDFTPLCSHCHPHASR